MIDGVAVDYGTYHTEGNLYGQLANGDILDCVFWCCGANDVILIPEPATILLLSLGAMMLRKNKIIRN